MLDAYGRMLLKDVRELRKHYHDWPLWQVVQIAAEDIRNEAAEERAMEREMDRRERELDEMAEEY